VKNQLEEGWKKQVIYLKEHYGYLFKTESEDFLSKPDLSKINQEFESRLDSLFKKKLFDFNKEVDKQLDRIDKEAKAISKEMREFKRKLISDLSNKK
jgi:hypothetical protein